MDRVLLQDLALHEPIEMVLLALSVEGKIDKNGGSFCKFVLSDGNVKVDAIRFDANANDFLYLDFPALVICKIEKSMYRDRVNYKLLEDPYDYELYKDVFDNSIRKDYTIRDFVISAPVDPEKMYDFVLDTCSGASKSASGNLFDIVKYLYTKHKEKLLTWAGGKSMHHAYCGGLLYHIYRMLGAATGMSVFYYNLDTELLLCGIALHDIGKLLEFDTNACGDVSYLTDGRLFGHLHMGAVMITNAAKDLVKDSDKDIYEVYPKLKALQHLILSHHGQLEYGAVTRPSMLEAYVLSELDMMDARCDQYEREVINLSPGEFSEPVAAMDGIRVWCPDYKNI